MVCLTGLCVLNCKPLWGKQVEAEAKFCQDDLKKKNPKTQTPVKKTWKSRRSSVSSKQVRPLWLTDLMIFHYIWARFFPRSSPSSQHGRGFARRGTLITQRSSSRRLCMRDGLWATEQEHVSLELEERCLFIVLMLMRYHFTMLYMAAQ